MIGRLPVCVASVLFLTTSPSPAARPNMVVILVDDLGVHDLSGEGSTYHQTPNIDAMARDSIRFDSAYAACQVCSPSRAAIQTGRHPVRTGVTNWISHTGSNQPSQWKRNTPMLPADYRPRLSPDETTVAERLRDVGYRTFFAGKWHLGGEGSLPTDQGYDISVGGGEYGSPPGGYFSPYNNPYLTDGPPGESLPLRLAAETSAFIRDSADRDEPFFAMLSFYSVHGPMQTTRELWQRYADRADALGLKRDVMRFVFDRTQEVRQVQDHPLYAGMIDSMDAAVGLVLESIHASGQSDDTVIVFTSDNGGVSSGDSYCTSCIPLRGGKGRQWEGGLRAPMYVRVPGVAPVRRDDQLAVGTDIPVTLLSLAGTSFEHDPRPGDGIDLTPVLRGGDIVDRDLLWHYPHYGNQGGEPSSIIRRGNWKLIRYHENGCEALYDLSADPGEQNDVAEDHRDVVDELSNTLTRFLDDTEAERPAPNPTFDAEARRRELQRIRSTVMPRREGHHRRLREPDYRPNADWWGSQHATK